MIYAVLSNFDFVAKFTVKNLNKNFINAVRGGGHRFMKVFHKIPVFFERWLSLVLSLMALLGCDGALSLSITFLMSCMVTRCSFSNAFIEVDF